MSFLAGLSAFGGGYAQGAEDYQRRQQQQLAQQMLMNQIQGQEGAYKAALLDQGGLSAFPQAPQMTPGAGAAPSPDQPTQPAPLGGVGPPTTFADRFNAAGPLPQPPTMSQAAPQMSAAGPAPGGSMLPGGERIMGPAPDPRQQAQTQLAVGLRAQEQRAQAAQTAQDAAAAKPGSEKDIGRLTPQDMQLAQATGRGPLTVGQAARRVEQVMPNASLQAKFQAMKQLYTLMTSQEQVQFQRAMQLQSMLFQQERMQEARETHKLQQLKSDADYHAISGTLTKQKQRIAQLDEFANTTVAFGNRLLQLAQQKSASGIPVIQAWIDAGRRATGDPLVKAFDAQLKGYTTDIARVMGTMVGVLSDRARSEASALIPEGATYAQIEAVVNTLRQDVITRKGEAMKIFNADRKRAAELRKQYGVTQVPFEEEEPSPTPEFTPPAGAAPAGIPSGVKITPIQ